MTDLETRYRALIYVIDQTENLIEDLGDSVDYHEVEYFRESHQTLLDIRCILERGLHTDDFNPFYRRI